MKNRTCFILGSGSSLLRLTNQEREYVNNSELVLAFNKYLIFSEQVGIRPTHYLLGDQGEKADLMLTETARICKKNNSEMNFVLTRHYQPGSGEYRERKSRIRSKYSKFDPISRWYRNLADDRAIEYMSRNAIYIERYNWLAGGKWARSLDEKIFHYRSSLSGAINIVNILQPGYDIKLLGVDLDDHAYFFQHQLDAKPNKWGVFLKRLTPGEKLHGTAANYKGNEGIQQKFPYIVEQVEKNGGHLFCCNPDSLLVKEGIVPFRGIESN